MPTAVILSQPVAVDLIIYRGDSGQFRVTVTDSLGAPIDVSAATWLCQIRPAIDDAVIWVTLTCTPTAGDVSSVDVVITPANSNAIVANGVFDLQMTLDGNVTTLLAGAVRTTKDVSRIP